MADFISNADKEVLAEVVRLAQKQGLKGSRGGWKDFLNTDDRKFGTSLSDPAKRPKELLVAFLNSFTKEHKKLLEKFIGRIADLHEIKKYMKDFSHLESPEQRLVRLTMEHPQYVQQYSFPFYDEEWTITRTGKISEALKSQVMVSIDCEMVLCSDGTEAVVKVCVVDQNLEIKLNEVVNPYKAIDDYRSPITGISAEDLEGVTCSLKDVQKSLKKLLSHGTILVGHSLHNDLRVLKLDHLRVIDTSYIFRDTTLPLIVPSLNNLCKDVLGFAIRKEGEPHDCLADAQAAMKLVLAKLDQGFYHPINVNPLGVDFAKLLLHKVPVDVPCKELQNLFSMSDNATIEPDLRIRGQFYSTFAVFKNASEAIEAFKEMEGQEKKDSFGRIQKHVSLKLSTGRTISFLVRSMGSDISQINSYLPNRTAPQVEPHEARREEMNDDINNSKRQKLCVCPCDHAKEIETLKQKLQQRDDEIFELQKMLAIAAGNR